MLPVLVILFVVTPMVEIWLLYRIGQAIDVGPTIALVILTGVVGAALARREGLRTFAAVSASMSHGELPARTVVEGLLILVAGILLVTPGVMTDAVGFMLLIPPLRRWVGRLLMAWLKKRVTVVHAGGAAQAPPEREFIDVEWRVVDSDDGGNVENESRHD